MSGSKVVKGLALLLVAALVAVVFSAFNSHAIQSGQVADKVASSEVPEDMVGEVESFTFLKNGKPMYTVDFDEDWIMRPGASDITGTSKDGMVWVLLTDMKGPIANFYAAELAVSKALMSNLNNVKKSKSVAGFEINGMTAAAYEGTAEDGDDDVFYLIVLFAVSRDEIGALVFLIDPDAKATHIEEVKQIARTAKPIRR